MTNWSAVDKSKASAGKLATPPPYWTAAGVVVVEEELLLDVPDEEVEGRGGGGAGGGGVGWLTSWQYWANSVAAALATWLPAPLANCDWLAESRDSWRDCPGLDAHWQRKRTIKTTYSLHYRWFLSFFLSFVCFFLSFLVGWFICFRFFWFFFSN